jgi:hypothetical protein
LIRGTTHAAGLFALLWIGACNPNTARPSFGPITGAATAEIDLRVPVATRVLTDMLRADSLPVSKSEPLDGYIETSWFDTATGKPAHLRRLGGATVRVRAWIDPTRIGHSMITVETLYHPLADPSLPERELDRQVPKDHPTGKRVDAIIEKLVRQYGDSAVKGPASTTTPTP